MILWLFLLILTCAIEPNASQKNNEIQTSGKYLICNGTSVRMILGQIDGKNRWLAVVIAVDWPQLSLLKFSLTLDAPANIEKWKRDIRVSTSDNRIFQIEASGANAVGNYVAFVIRFDSTGSFPNVKQLKFFDKDVCPDPLQVNRMTDPLVFPPHHTQFEIHFFFV